MSTAEHRARAIFCAQGLTDFDGIDRVIVWLVGQLHFAASVGEFIGEAKDGGWRYAGEVGR